MGDDVFNLRSLGMAAALAGPVTVLAACGASTLNAQDVAERLVDDGIPCNEQKILNEYAFDISAVTVSCDELNVRVFKDATDVESATKWLCEKLPANWGTWVFGPNWIAKPQGDEVARGQAIAAALGGESVDLMSKCAQMGWPEAMFQRTEDGVMSKAEAGAVYLDAICKINAATDKLYSSGDPFLTGDSNPDLVPLDSTREAAREAVPAFSEAIASLQQAGGAWPDSVSDDIAVVLQGLEQEVVYFEALTEAATWGDVTYPDTSVSAFARIRDELGLPPAGDVGDGGC